MTRFSKQVFGTLILLGIFVPVFGENLLKNSDFSAWNQGKGLPEYWNTWDKSLSEGELSRETDTGKTLVKYANGSQNHQLFQVVKVNGGETYELSCLKKVQINSFYFIMAIQWKDKAGRGIKYFMELDGGYDNGFQSLRKIVKAPEEADSAYIIVGPYCIHRKGKVAKGNMWVTDVYFGPPTPEAKKGTGLLVIDNGRFDEARKILKISRCPQAPNIRARLKEVEQQYLKAKNLQEQDTGLSVEEQKQFKTLSEKFKTDWQVLKFDLNLARIYPGESNGSVQKFAVGAVTESDKIYPYTEYQGSLIDPIQLALAGNEYGSFQLVIIPFWTDLKNVSISFSSLKGPDGKVIPANNICWFREDYVTLEKPNPWLGLKYEHLREPDQLLPAKPFDVKQGTVKAVWVDIRMPEDMPEGFYKGTVKVTADDQSVVRSFQVKSFGFNIPLKSSIKNEFWWTPSNWQKFFSWGMRYTPESHAKHAAVLGRYRVSSFPCDWITLCKQVPIYAEKDGSFTFDWTTFDKYVKNALDNNSTAFWSALSCNSGWTSYLHNPKTKVIERATGKTVALKKYLPPGGVSQWELAKLPYRENRVYRDFLKAYVKHLKELGINDCSYYELFDEPGGDRFRAMLKHHTFFREVVPDLKLLDFGVHPIQNVDGNTAEGVIDAWAPHFDVLNRPEALSAMYARRAKHGEELWAYTCIEKRLNPDGKASHSSKYTSDHYSPFCLYFRPYIALRIHAWMAWKYKLDGYYIFMMNAVPDINASKESDKRWPNSEWSDGREKGSGTLVYPGPGFKIIPSMRLANIRKGLEDYEYFAKLKSMAAKLDATKHKDLLQRVNKALAVDKDIVGSVFDWTKDREKLEKKREELAALIKAVNHAVK